MQAYLKQLNETLGRDGFMTVYYALRNDNSMNEKAVAAIANAFYGPVAPSTRRNKALGRILCRHRKLVDWTAD